MLPTPSSMMVSRRVPHPFAIFAKKVGNLRCKLTHDPGLSSPSVPGPQWKIFKETSPGLQIITARRRTIITWAASTRRNPSESKARRKPKEMQTRTRTPLTRMVSNICKQPQQNQRITAAPCPYPIETKRLPCRDRNQGGGVSKPGQPR